MFCCSDDDKSAAMCCFSSLQITCRVMQVHACMPLLAGLARLSSLSLAHCSGLASLPQLHPLLLLPGLRQLSVEGCPLAGLTLLRHYVAFRWEEGAGCSSTVYHLDRIKTPWQSASCMPYLWSPTPSCTFNAVLPVAGQPPLLLPLLPCAAGSPACRASMGWPSARQRWRQQQHCLAHWRQHWQQHW
jgi:hypothetical protein